MRRNDWSRRDFLKTASAATMAALAAGAPRLWAAEEVEKPQATADTLIILWMAGGMAHTETFDPKRYAPFEKGMDSNKVLSTFPAIDTVVRTHSDHEREHFEKEGVGRVMMGERELALGMTDYALERLAQ